MSYDLIFFKNLSVLFAEDDDIVRAQVTETLRIFFGKIFIAKDGEEAFEIFKLEKPDIILSDIKMPKIDGLQLIEKIREENQSIPIIILTSYSDQNTLFKAANSSIDGYILKPLELNNFLETFDKVIRRKKSIRKFFTFCDGLIYNLLSDELYKNAEVINLGKKEKDLLRLFIDNYDRTLTKEQIIEHIWGYEEITDSALKNLLNRLRSKIGFDIILSIKGRGWKLDTAR
ncbi:MAG: response regulator transcription factor [Aliarcobacter sp.]|nr:response regulator transcription factor [Aliarcobacter sp.]